MPAQTTFQVIFHRYRVLWLVATGLLLGLAYGGFILPYYFNPEQKLGFDHASHFARMVSAEFLFRTNGFGFFPAFTPAMCAGSFQAVSPNDFTYSFLQLFSLVSNPLIAAFSIHWLFAVLGGVGTHYLVRTTPFLASHWSALAAATLFGFNSFFLARMIEGHLNFHTFMLLPFICLTILSAAKAKRFESAGLWSIGAALTASLVILGGGAHLAIPIGLGVGLILLLASLMPKGPELSRLALMSALALVMTTLLCSTKLAAAYSLSMNFPRDLYDLSGVTDLTDALLLPITSLLGFPHIDQVGLIGPHEFEYSVSPLVLPGLGLALLATWAKYKRQLFLYGLAFTTVYLVVASVNYANPTWHGWLTTLPVISESASLYRWYASLILVLIVISTLGIDGFKRVRPVLCAAIILLVPIWQMYRTVDWQSLPVVNYTPLLAGLAASRVDGIKPITRLHVNFNEEGQPIGPTSDSDVGFPDGGSQVFCYEPLFGYHGEKLKIENLRMSDVRFTIGNEFNMKNPACYIYPDANNCSAGDNFTLAQASTLKDFTEYKDWDFAVPWYQSAANTITKLSWLIIILTLIALWIRQTLMQRR